MKKLSFYVWVILLVSIFSHGLSAMLQDSNNEEIIVQSTATIDLLEDVEGRLIAKDKSGEIVTEISKEYGKVTSISFEPGEYHFTLLSNGKHFYIRNLILIKDGRLNLQMSDFSKKKSFKRKVKKYFKERRISRKSLLKGKHKVNFFLESSVKSTFLNDKRQFLMGGSIGVILGEKLLLGFGGYGNISLATRDDELEDEDVLLGYGGFMIGYNFNPGDLVNFRLSALLGAGSESKVGDDHGWHNDWCDDNHWDIFDFDLHDGKIFYIFEPQIDVFINLNSHLKLSGILSYRFVDSSRSDLKGFAFGCGFQFNF